MSEFHSLSTPAPKVEAAVADRAEVSEPVFIERAVPSEDVRVTPAPRVEPATTEYDQQVRNQAHANLMGISKMTKQSVDQLVASGGVQFESQAGVLVGKPQKTFLRRAIPFLFDERDFVSMGEVSRFVVVKDGFCFVYGQRMDPNPLYIVPLGDVYGVMEDPKNPDPNSVTVSPRVNTNEGRESFLTVLLKYSDTKKQAYQFTFDEAACGKGVAHRFLEIVGNSAKTPLASAVASPIFGVPGAKSGK